MKQERLNDQLVLRVPTPLRERLECIAAERDRSLAYLLREAINDWTERQRGDAAFTAARALLES